MRKTILIFLLCLISLSQTNAQSISCNDFCVTAMEPDSVNQGQTNIHIYMGGSASNFINYPIVSCVIDANGDTLGTGSLFYFGQLGNTTQIYFITGGNMAFVPGQAYTIFFQFDSLICSLPYPCPTQTINDFFTESSPYAYPNPTHGKFRLHFTSSIFSSSAYLELINVFGESAWRYSVNFPTTEFDLSGKPPGIYFLKVYDGLRFITIPLVLEE